MTYVEEGGVGEVEDTNLKFLMAILTGNFYDIGMNV